MAKGCVVVGDVSGRVVTVTSTIVYVGHAIDFHVDLATYVVAPGEK